MVPEPLLTRHRQERSTQEEVVASANAARVAAGRLELGAGGSTEVFDICALDEWG